MFRGFTVRFCVCITHPLRFLRAFTHRTSAAHTASESRLSFFFVAYLALSKTSAVKTVALLYFFANGSAPDFETCFRADPPDFHPT